jgi:hypothetical protein
MNKMISRRILMDPMISLPGHTDGPDVPNSLSRSEKGLQKQSDQQQRLYLPDTLQIKARLKTEAIRLPP